MVLPYRITIHLEVDRFVSGEEEATRIANGDLSRAVEANIQTGGKIRTATRSVSPAPLAPEADIDCEFWPVALFECKTCRAHTTDRVAHRQWHDNMERAMVAQRA